LLITIPAQCGLGCNNFWIPLIQYPEKLAKRESITHMQDDLQQKEKWLQIGSHPGAGGCLSDIRFVFSYAQGTLCFADLAQEDHTRITELSQWHCCRDRDQVCCPLYCNVHERRSPLPASTRMGSGDPSGASISSSFSNAMTFASRRSGSSSSQVIRAVRPYVAHDPDDHAFHATPSG